MSEHTEGEWSAVRLTDKRFVGTVNENRLAVKVEKD